MFTFSMKLKFEHVAISDSKYNSLLSKLITVLKNR